MTVQVDTSISGLELGARIHRLYRRAEAMGLLPDQPELASWDPDALAQATERLLDALKGVGIGRSVPEFRSDVIRRAPDRYIVYLDEVLDALEDSPSPTSEIQALVRDVFNWEDLSRYTGAAEQSLRRYASGERAAPDDIANRIHWLTGVVADLRAAYNDAGVRRWFQRPRHSFEGRSPSEFLTGSWTPDDEHVARIRDFAARFAQPTPAT